MKRLITLLLILMVAWYLLGQPAKYNKNGLPTDYCWYCNKYGDLWELTDSCKILTDTVYCYCFGGQKWRFNQDGELVGLK